MPICVGEGVISFPLDVPVSHRYTTVKHILKIRGVLTHVARIAVRVLLALASVAVLLVAAATAWLFVCASDLPNVQAMSSFAPQAPTNIPDASICGEKARVIALPSYKSHDRRTQRPPRRRRRHRRERNKMLSVPYRDWSCWPCTS